MSKDYYEILGIDSNASSDEIKKAYRKLAKQYHPDMNPGDAEAEQKFKDINEAYSTLSDPDKKQMYDMYGSEDPTDNPFAGFDPFNFFGGMRGSTFRNASTSIRGSDINHTMSISFKDSIFGCKKEITLDALEICDHCAGTGAKNGAKPVTCPDCKGSGQKITSYRQGNMIMQNITTCPKCRGTGKYIKDVCTHCKGEGLTPKKRVVTVTIPAGVMNGQALTVRGQGHYGPNNGPPGDLQIYVNVVPHPLFSRNQANPTEIKCEIPISLKDAILGGKIKIPTLYGDEERILNPGTQSGTKIVLKEKGTYDIRNPRIKGDQIVNIIVEIPSGLDDYQKNLFNENLNKFGENNYPRISKYEKIKKESI